MRLPDSAIRLAAGVGRAFSAVAGDSREIVGPEAGFWNRLRRATFPALDRALGDTAKITRPTKERRYAGTWRTRPEQVEETLWALGFRRNPMASVKRRGDDLELGSWVLRDGPDARRQIHAILLPAAEGDGVDVYAHEEPSSVHPELAVDHYCGSDVNDDMGVTHLRSVLPLEQDRDRDVPEPEPEEEPACPNRLIDELAPETPGGREVTTGNGVAVGD